MPWYAEGRVDVKPCRPSAKARAAMTRARSIGRSPNGERSFMMTTQNGSSIEAATVALDESSFMIHYTEILEDGVPAREETQFWKISEDGDTVQRTDHPAGAINVGTNNGQFYAAAVPRCPSGTYPKWICTAISVSRAKVCCGWALTPLGFAGCGKNASVWYNAGCIAAFVAMCAGCAGTACISSAYVCANP